MKLRKYEALLHCQEVRRRAGSTADRGELATYASELLRTIVSGISDPTRQIVAQAALCTEEQYEGRRVIQREELLGKLPERITKDMFRYHRELVFEEIVELLYPEVSSTAAVETQQSSMAPAASSPDGYYRFLTTLAKSAAALHYAGLGTLFAYDFDDELRANDIPIWEYDLLWPPTTLADYLFETYINFIYPSWALSLVDAPVTDKYLSANTVSVLLSLWQRTADASPAGPHNVTAEQRKYLNTVHTFGLGHHGVHTPVITELYREKWEKWCQGRPQLTPRYADTPTRKDLFEKVAPIVAASGAFVAVLTRHCRVDVPLHVQARALTHKALSSCYTFDERLPIIDGKSLRDRADSYLDSESVILTNRELKCYNIAI